MSYIYIYIYIYIYMSILLRADIAQKGLVVSMHVYLCTDLYSTIHFTP